MPLTLTKQEPKELGTWEPPNAPLNSTNGHSGHSNGSSNPFKKATKEGIFLRMALDGPPGSGKTMTALKCATEIGGKIAFIDTEHGSARRYADLFDFDHIAIEDYSPDNYVRLIEAASAAGYTTVIIDSMSHAWSGKNGMIEQVDAATKRLKSGNSFQAWGEMRPMESTFWETILACPAHIIACFRTKQAYEVQSENGKMKPVKLGLAPIQREGIEYEFDIVGNLTIDNEVTFAKTRCADLKNKLFKNPGKNMMDIIIPWLGTPEAEAPKREPENSTRLENEQPSRYYQMVGRGIRPDEAGAEKASVVTVVTVSEFTPEHGYPNNELDTIAKITVGEETLKIEKVRGWLTTPQLKKSRSEFFTDGDFKEADLNSLHKYLQHLRKTVESLPA